MKIDSRLQDRIDAFGGWLARRADRGMRRRAVLATLVLAVPCVALVQPFGLLLWARLRLLTSIPRTAMAIEEETVLAADVTFDDVFPDLPGIRPTRVTARDPLAVSRNHFPRTLDSTAEPAFGPKSSPQPVDEQTAASTLRRELEVVVARLKVQGLMPGQGLALIDGRVRRVGDEFGSGAFGRALRLTEVRHSTIVVEVEGLEFDIRLNGGGTGSVDFRP
ncbi:MAG: hypothetical protein VX726_03065 [Planctomycetota bacterium]|nr:hypothetical protein [Planctomycetota bacterium]